MNDQKTKKEEIEEEALELISKANDLHSASNSASNKKIKKDLRDEAEELEHQAEEKFKEGK